MRAVAAFRDGVGRVRGAAALVAGLFVLTLATALPLSYIVRGMIAAHLGASLAAEAAASGTNYGWWQEFTAQASGLGQTFVPSIAGFGAVLDNLDGIADNLPMVTALAVVTGGWLVVWSFLSGGILDRLARGRKTRAHGFFAACGVHFWRLLRLGVIVLIVYAFLFGYVHGWLLTTGFDRVTRDVTVERTAFILRGLGYLLFGSLVVACNLAFDYARIRLVVEDRRSAVGALLAGLRFLRRHLGAALGLYALNAVAFILLVAAYGLLAPGAPRAGWSLAAVLLVGELYILGRLSLKLIFYASETALFQGALAHAAYTAAPTVLWPDSPAAESIANADRLSPS